MNTIDRRALTRKILFGAAIAGLGLSAGPAAVSAMPLDDRLPDALEGSIDKAQVLVTRPPPRRPPPRHSPPGLALLAPERPARLRLALGVAQGASLEPRLYSLANG